MHCHLSFDKRLLRKELWGYKESFFQVGPRLKNALEALAEEENRSLSNCVGTRPAEKPKLKQ
jgi:hypothetical protein